MPALPAFVAVGIDRADAYHVVHAEAAGLAPDLRLRISNDLAGFQLLLTRLREAFGDLPWRIALENPTLLIGRFLLQAGYAVYALNPRSVARMREALAASGKKDDPLDADALCLLLRKRAEDLSPVSAGSADSRLLAGLVRQRVAVVEEKNRVLNQLTAVLKSYYPRALELFKNLEQPLTLAFLTRFDRPTVLATATEAQWQELFVGQRYPRPSRIKPLWQQALQPQVAVFPEDEMLGARQVRRLLCSLQVLLEELRALDTEIELHFDQFPDAKVFRSLPGAAAVLAPALAALFGEDRSRWSDWREIARNSGAVPVTRSSGKFRGVGMRRHCDHLARRTLHLFATASRRSCAWAREFYQAQRQAGKSHGTALRNLATKWLRILFRLWQERTTYDEAKYLDRRASRHAPRGGAAPATTAA